MVVIQEKHILWALGYTYPMVWGRGKLQLLSAKSIT